MSKRGTGFRVLGISANCGRIGLADQDEVWKDASKNLRLGSHCERVHSNDVSELYYCIVESLSGRRVVIHCTCIRSDRNGAVQV